MTDTIETQVTPEAIKALPPDMVIQTPELVGTETVVEEQPTVH